MYSKDAKTATLLTKLMNGFRRSTFDTGCRLHIEYSEIIAHMNFTGVTNHPETALRVKVAVTRTKAEHACLNTHQFSYIEVHTSNKNSRIEH